MCEMGFMIGVNGNEFIQKLNTIDSDTILNKIIESLENENKGERFNKLKTLYSLKVLQEQNILIQQQLSYFITPNLVKEYSNLINEINKEK